MAARPAVSSKISTCRITSVNGLSSISECRKWNQPTGNIRNGYRWSTPCTTSDAKSLSAISPGSSDRIAPSAFTSELMSMTYGIAHNVPASLPFTRTVHTSRTSVSRSETRSPG